MMMFKLVKTLSCLAILISNCNSSLIKNTDWDVEESSVEVPALVVSEPVSLAVTETAQTTTSEVAVVQAAVILPVEAEPEVLNYEETEAIEIQNGHFFRLMMTVAEEWNDEYMNKNKSEMFTSVGNSLGDELSNFTSKTQGELIKFKLVEVRPVKDSLQNVYVTFVVSSDAELKGEELSNSISSQILLYGKIYNHKASSEGFMMENISEETAKELEEEKIACESAEINTDQSLNHGISNFTSTVESLIPNTIQQLNASHEVIHSFETLTKCQHDKIQRGSTSIYIFEASQASGTEKTNDDDSEMMADEPLKTDVPGASECMKNFKRSTFNDSDESDESETVVIIRKRGNKVFIEI